MTNTGILRNKQYEGNPYHFNYRLKCDLTVEEMKKREKKIESQKLADRILEARQRRGVLSKNEAKKKEIQDLVNVLKTLKQRKKK